MKSNGVPFQMLNLLESSIDNLSFITNVTFERFLQKSYPTVPEKKNPDFLAQSKVVKNHLQENVI